MAKTPERPERKRLSVDPKASELGKGRDSAKSANRDVEAPEIQLLKRRQSRKRSKPVVGHRRLGDIELSEMFAPPQPLQSRVSDLCCADVECLEMCHRRDVL